MQRQEGILTDSYCETLAQKIPRQPRKIPIVFDLSCSCTEKSKQAITFFQMCSYKYQEAKFVTVYKDTPN